MNENRNVVFSTGKRFALDTIGAYLLWGLLYSLAMGIIILGISFVSGIVMGFSRIAGTIMLLIGLYVAIFFIFKANWKSAVRTAFNRGNLYKKDVSTVKKGVTIFVVIAVALGLLFSLITTSSQIKKIDAELERLNEYEGSWLYETSVESLKTNKTVTITTTIVSVVVSILMNKYMINFVAKIVTQGAVDDSGENIDNIQYNQKRTSLLVPAIIAYVVISLIPVLLAVLVVISNLGTDSMVESVNNIAFRDAYGSLTDRLTMEYTDLKVKANMGPNASGIIDVKDAAKAYEEAIALYGFGNVTLIENVPVECTMTRGNYTAKFKFTLKGNGDYTLSGFEIEE